MKNNRLIITNAADFTASRFANLFKNKTVHNFEQFNMSWIKRAKIGQIWQRILFGM